MDDDLTKLKQTLSQQHRDRMKGLRKAADDDREMAGPAMAVGVDRQGYPFVQQDGGIVPLRSLSNTNPTVGKVGRAVGSGADFGSQRRPEEPIIPKSVTGVIKICTRTNLADRTLFYVGGVYSSPRKILELPLASETPLIPAFQVIGPRKDDWLFTTKTLQVGSNPKLYKIRTIYGDGRTFETDWDGKFQYLVHQGNGFWQGSSPIPDVVLLTNRVSTFAPIYNCSPRYSTYNQTYTVTTTATGWTVYNSETNQFISSEDYLAQTPYDPAFNFYFERLETVNLVGTCVAYFENNVYVDDRVDWAPGAYGSTDPDRSGYSFKQFWGKWIDGQFEEWRGDFSYASEATHSQNLTTTIGSQTHTWRQYISPMLSEDCRENYQTRKQLFPSQFIDEFSYDIKTLGNTVVFSEGYLTTEEVRSFPLQQLPLPGFTRRYRLKSGPEAAERDIAAEPTLYPSVTGYGAVAAPTWISGAQLRYSTILREDGTSQENWLKAKSSDYNLREGDDMSTTVVAHEPVKKVPIKYSQIGISTPGVGTVSIVGAGYWPQA